MSEEPQTIWGIPVVPCADVPESTIHIVVGRGVIRQDGVLEWDGDHLIVREIGDPYHA